MADFLSRLHRTHDESKEILVEDSFPNKILFVVSVRSPWFADTTNYLSTAKLPSHVTPKENKRIIKLSAFYSWIQQDLFYT